MAKFKMTHTFEQVRVGIAKRAEILRNAGIIEHGSFSAYVPTKGGKRGMTGFKIKDPKRREQDAEEHTPSLKSLEAFSAPEE